MPEETCYACPQPPTTREHAPARCIFPKAFRAAPITVPSCVKHNSAKSGDDELLRHVVCAAEGTNKYAVEVFESVVRSFEQRPHIMSTFMPSLRPARIDGEETGGHNVDLKRFERSVGMIVRALYYHEFQERLHAHLQVIWAGLLTRDMTRRPFMKPTISAHLAFGPVRSGRHPQIFQYDFNDTVSKRKPYVICRLRFFEGIPICVMWDGNTPRR